MFKGNVKLVGVSKEMKDWVGKFVTITKTTEPVGKGETLFVGLGEDRASIKALDANTHFSLNVCDNSATLSLRDNQIEYGSIASTVQKDLGVKASAVMTEQEIKEAFNSKFRLVTLMGFGDLYHPNFSTYSVTLEGKIFCQHIIILNIANSMPTSYTAESDIEVSDVIESIPDVALYMNSKCVSQGLPEFTARIDVVGSDNPLAGNLVWVPDVDVTPTKNSLKYLTVDAKVSLKRIMRECLAESCKDPMTVALLDDAEVSIKFREDFEALIPIPLDVDKFDGFTSMYIYEKHNLEDAFRAYEWKGKDSMEGK